jgi:hypothetical protein
MCVGESACAKIHPVAFMWSSYPGYNSGKSDNTFPYGPVIGGLVGLLALLLFAVAMFRYKPFHIFDPFLRKDKCKLSIKLLPSRRYRIFSQSPKKEDYSLSLLACSENMTIFSAQS